MAQRLITGVPGAGKTLFAVSQVLQPLLGTFLELEDGRKIPRRLFVGGVRDLIIEHEPVDVATFDPEAGMLTSGGRQFACETDERKPGEAPHDCEHRVDNWWRWVMPGDVILVDECQRLFRPMASGRKLPMYISGLERHRHYGVDFIFITQHPQLVHSNVRNLIDRHNHLRRVLGSHTVINYEWDHCTNPDRIKTATAAMWRHDQKAYKLYKSAEAHTKHAHRVPATLVALLVALVLLPGLAWYGKERFFRDRTVTLEAAKAAHIKPPGGASSSPGGQHVEPGAVGVIAGAVGAFVDAVKRPVYVGCVSSQKRCVCIDGEGHAVSLSDLVCRAAVQIVAGPVALWPEGGSKPSTSSAMSAPIFRDAPEVGGAPVSFGGENGGFVKLRRDGK